MIGGICAWPVKSKVHPDGVTQERHSHYIAALVRGVMRDLGRLGREGVTISRLYAYSERFDSVKMCLDLEMQPWARPIGDWCTFVMDVEKSSSFFVQPYKMGLNDWKRNHSTPTRKTPPRPVHEHIAVSESKSTLPDNLVVATTFATLHGIAPRP